LKIPPLGKDIDPLLRGNLSELWSWIQMEISTHRDEIIEWKYQIGFYLESAKSDGYFIGMNLERYELP
jgi:hypothetical protein